jgi:hypothetical protein
MPTPQTLVHWLLTCLAVGHCKGDHVLGGWSPFRSVEALLTQREDGSGNYHVGECYNYKVGDSFSWDLELQDPLDWQNFDLEHHLMLWWGVAQQFARLAAHMVHRHGLAAWTLREMLQREWEQMPRRMAVLLPPHYALAHLQDVARRSFHAAIYMPLVHAALMNPHVLAPRIAGHRSAQLAMLLRTARQARFPPVLIASFAEWLGF